MTSHPARFISSFDGARIAWAVSGKGPPVVLLPSWLTHLDHQRRSVAWRPWIEALEARYRLIRYDPRGCGLSDRSLENLSFEAWVRDLEALVAALGLDRFSLIGTCQGGAVAIAYAGRNPARVERLVLYGTYARGRERRGDPPTDPEKARVMLEMLRLGWADPDHAFMRAFATQFQPGGGIEHLQSWCALQRHATSAENAVALTRAMFDIDVSAEAARIGCPTLVAHPARDAVAPVTEGRLLARLIPGAQYLELDSNNHFLRPDEPAWAGFLGTLTAFLPAAPEGALAGLSPREREVLAQVARGLANPAIAAGLGLSEKTVRNHVSAILQKLGCASRAQAVARARDAGLGGAG